MINLLPDNQKILINNEYRLRFRVIAAFFVTCILGMGVILLAPSYFLTLYQDQAVMLKGSHPPSAADAQARKSFESTLKEYKGVIKALAVTPVSSTNPSALITEILDKKTDAIRITEIVYAAQVGTSPLTITIRGIAKTRQNLVDFTTALRRVPFIADVNLPVSNFTKDSNIDFSFQVIGTP